MKKHLHFAFVFLVILVTSCAIDKLEVQENYTTNPENVWAYDGDNTTIKGVIKELREGTNRISLERRLLKNDVLWKNAEPLIIEDKKRILVPFLSVDKENVIGFFALYRDSKGKIQYDMTVRSDVYNKKIKLPFWDSSIWAGYFTAYDKTILGKRNGNPGVMRKAIPKEQLNAMTSRFETSCYNVPYTSCVSVGDDCYDNYTGEWTSCGGSSTSYCTTYYNFECFTYWIDDEPTPNPTPDPTPDPGTGSLPTLIPPSCESFNFVTKSGTIWQESAVVNIHFNIIVLTPNGYHFTQIIEFPNAILFGAPTNIMIGDTNITSGMAANLSAKAVQISMNETVSLYGNKPVSELTVSLYFQERLKYNYPLFIPGGRVNFNAYSFTGTPTNYETNLFGTGNCN